MDKYGFSSKVKGIKSQLLGGADRGTDVGILGLDITKVISVRVYHGGALDGIRFILQDSNIDSDPKPVKKTPVVPPRTYLGKLTNSFKSSPAPVPAGPSGNNKSVLFGKQTNNFTDVTLEPNEIITGFNVRCGAWIDGVQFITNHGRMTDMFGNKNGGSLAELLPPQGQQIVGVYGRVGQWIDAIGIVYAEV